MKKSCLIPVLLFFLIFPICAQSKYGTQNEIINLSLTENAGVLNGNINEYVYLFGECLNDEGLLSRLDWDVKNVFFYEQKIQMDIAKYIYLGLDIFSAFSKKSGNMQDYDWLNYKYWPKDPPTELTNYSIHDNYIEGFNKFNLSLGLNFFIIPETILSAFLQYEYACINFTASDGYKTYKSDNWEPIDFEGKVILYKQIFHAPFIGLSLRTKIIPHFLINTNIAISPFLMTIDSYDYHLKNRTNGGTVFWDKIINSFALKTSAGIQFNFVKHHNIGLNASLCYLPISIGEDSTKLLDADGNISSNSKEWVVQSCFGGTSNFLWSIALSYTFTLF